MQKAVLILLGALVVGAAAWLLGFRAERAIPPTQPPQARVEPVQRPVEPVPETAAVVAPALPPAAPEEEPAVERAPETYGIKRRFLPKLEEYREAESIVDREEPLMDLALADDPGVLPFLIDELNAAKPENRDQILWAMKQYGSREAIPAIRDLAEQVEDAEQRAELIETAEWLALPSLTEVRLGLWKPGDPLPEGDLQVQ